jgi:predicted transcriptional regulator
VVDENDRICGVVSEADLIRDAFPPDARTHLFPRQRVHRTAVLVSEVMTSPAITVHESTDVADVVELMTSNNLKSLPVVDEDHRVVGVVSRSDLMRVRARRDDLVEQDVEALLASIGHRDWNVGVHDGVVDITGPSTTLDRSIAEVAAQTVTGVVAVEIR